jgi:hypothetical protein
MNAEAIEVIVGMLAGTAIVIAVCTDFFDTIFNRGKETVEVEVVPYDLIESLQVVIDEIRDLAGDDKIALPPSERKRLFNWASAIERALNEED